MADVITGPVTPVDEARYLVGKAYALPYLQFVQALHDGVPISAPTRGLTFRLRPTTDCGRCAGPLQHQHECRAGAPNLEIPAFGLRAWWYSTPMRGAWFNKPITVEQFRGVLQWVLTAEAQRTLCASVEVA
jgi:hypothetical protein